MPSNLDRSFLRTLLCFLFILLLLLAKTAPARNTVQVAAPVRERLSLDRGWLFHEGEIAFPMITGHQASYNNAKAGSSSGAASPDYDDASWKHVNLPHDWAVEQRFDENANISQGYRQRGIGWYRRHFRLDPGDQGKHLEIQQSRERRYCRRRHNHLDDKDAAAWGHCIAAVP